MNSLKHLCGLSTRSESDTSMAPLAEAVKTRYKGREGDWEVYEGEVDALWTIAAKVPLHFGKRL